jgi:hypothetical protein
VGILGVKKNGGRIFYILFSLLKKKGGGRGFNKETDMQKSTHREESNFAGDYEALYR